MNSEFSTWSFWISVIGTLTGIISLCITCLTLKNTKDIKTNLYKKRLCKDSIEHLKTDVKDIDGRIRYINKDKCIERFDFVRQFSPIIAILDDLRIILTKKQIKQLDAIKIKYENIVNQNELSNSAIDQLRFLTELRQYCNQITIYYKENDYE